MGVTGKGINKNIMDDYRYIVQNYAPGDEIYLFGFSRGAYTVRSLCGLINNCGILKRPDARLIETAFSHYKKSGKAFRPGGEASVKFRNQHSHANRNIAFVGVWDTVGALGVPFSFLGLMDREVDGVGIPQTSHVFEQVGCLGFCRLLLGSVLARQETVR